MFKKFIEDLKKYRRYISYTTKVNLKAEVAGTYLSWLWLILEPICFMLIYVFIAKYIFNSRVTYYVSFVFIGITIWKFFNNSLSASVKMVKNNRDIVTKVYVPKWILLVSKLSVNTVKFFISFMLVVISMIVYQVPITINVLAVIPIMIGLYLFTFGICSIFMHLGVFIEDLSNITTIGLKMLFYLSGIFYVIDSKIAKPFGSIISYGNPIAVFISQCRDVLIYGQSLNYLLLGIWILVSIVMCMIGIRTIYKYENTYVKVMR